MANALFSSTPPKSPASGDDPLNWLRLIRSRRVGPTTFHRLIAEHGTAEAALEALPEIARAAGVENYTPCPPAIAQAELNAGRKAGARLIRCGTPAYPAGLAEMSDAPPLLWAMGDLDLFARPMIALVGARNASSLGTRMAKALAASLTEAGFVVVSGLARGIDAAAHASALPATVAVQAGGVDVIYPSENADLARQIAQSGCRVSEQPMGMEPQARHFPTRNRIISGLSRAVVVVEAAARSGSLITAKTALDQGREVFAVPGHPFDARAGGCNILIRDGATLVRNAADVLDAIAPDCAPQHHAPEPPTPQKPRATTPNPPLRQIAALHTAILNRLGPSPVAEDQLIRDLALPASAIAPELLTLELEGKVQRQPGGLLARLN
ncbi:MAG: DNA-processing protein DprA [Paracoccaceae bacterium]|nr:DNA-processing protein DprA [Paracoccaceae bacterium]